MLKLKTYDVTDFDKELGVELEFRGKSFELIIGKIKLSIWLTRLIKTYK